MVDATAREGAAVGAGAALALAAELVPLVAVAASGAEVEDV